VDGTKCGGVAVVLEGVGSRASIGSKLWRQTSGKFADARVVAIDVPIGFGPRVADRLAREKDGGIPERRGVRRERTVPSD
jgi:hypothetical protein